MSVSRKQTTLFRIERFASEIPTPAVVLTLPWPPTVNTYWRHIAVGRQTRVLISKAGRRYRTRVQAAWLTSPRPKLTGRLAVEILAMMPDRRARDIDNIAKATLDALQHAGAFADDNQVDRLVIARAGVKPPGSVEVRIAMLEGASGG